jgi:hypothetical protein
VVVNASTIDTYFPLYASTGKNLLPPVLLPERGYVDAVIQPRGNRRRTIAALEVLDGKRTGIHNPQTQEISYTSGTFHEVLCGGRNWTMRFVLHETLGPMDSLSG